VRAGFRPPLVSFLFASSVLLSSCADWNSGRAGQVVEARVVSVLENGERSFPGMRPQPFQVLELEIAHGLYQGDRVTANWGGRTAMNYAGILREGDRVLVTSAADEAGERQYAIVEVVRLPALLPFAAALVIALLATARWKGFASLVGLAASVGVYLLAVIPSVQRGDDPLIATLAGSIGVLIVAVYAVHGLNRKSTAALVGAAGGVAVVGGLAAASIALAHLTGLATEEDVFLMVASGGRIDLPKLVLAGFIVGSLGALVDMAVGQASTTFELADVDRSLRGRGLYGRALNVGRDHIGSLVNTLALAYFGATLPLLVLLAGGDRPLSVALNGETIAGSVLAVLVASIGLVLCVPLTTLIAVWLADRQRA
jgi:uncharacterized membrane protein